MKRIIPVTIMKASELIMAIQGHKGSINVEDASEILDTIGDESFAELLKDIKELVHHRDTTVGLWATDKDPISLLKEFWDSEMENPEFAAPTYKWRNWVKKIFFQI